MTIKRTIAAAMLVAVAGGAASAATITNGSFEDNTGVPGGQFTTLGAGSSAIAGWTIDSGTVDLIDDYWQASDGDYSLDMNGFELPGSISTEITDLIAGTVYMVEFDMSGNPDGAPTTKSLLVNVDEDGTYQYDTVGAGTTRAVMNYETKQYFFTADDTTAILKFSSLDDGSFGAALDNVRVSVAIVPLPASLTLLLGGLGGLALVRRRRKSA